MAPNKFAVTFRRSLALAAFSTFAVASALPGRAEPGGAELGLWINHTGRGAIELYKCGGSVCGRIVWVRDPTNAAGKPRTDINNPEPGRRGRAICGLVTFSGLKRTASGWGDGQGYNPEDGTSFNVSIQLSGASTLKVTGSKFIFSKTVYWKRPTQEIQRCDRPAVPATPPPQIAAPKPAAPAAPAAAIVPAKAAVAEGTGQDPAPTPPKPITAPQALGVPPLAEGEAPEQAAPVTAAAPDAPVVKPAVPKPAAVTKPAQPAGQPAKTATTTPQPQPAARPVAPKPVASPSLAKPAIPKPPTTTAAPVTAKVTPPAPPAQVKAAPATANTAAAPPNGGWPITGSGQRPDASVPADAMPAAAPVQAPVAKKSPPRKKPEIFDGTTIPMTVLR